MQDLIKLCGLWKKDGQNGPFYSGKLTYGTQLFVFKNGHKAADKDPDLIVYLGKYEPSPKDDQGAKPTADGAPF